MEQFFRDRINEYTSRIKKITKMTPEQYNRFKPSEHPVLSQLVAVEAEIETLLFWLERSGVLDNTDND